MEKTPASRNILILLMLNISRVLTQSVIKNNKSINLSICYFQAANFHD